MRKLRRLLFALLLLGIVAMAVLFTTNTISYQSKQVAVTPPTPEKISYEATERLSKAIQFATVSRDAWVDTAAFLHLDTFLRKSYPLVDSLLERETVNGLSQILKWPGANARLAPILLMAHLDVVPVENDGKGWLARPFGGKMDDRHIWGRGSLDDKASVCGILEAVEMLLSADYTPQRTVFIAFGHDEEIGGANGAKRIAELFRERGTEFEFVLDEGGLIVENALPGLDRPLAMIGVGEKGYATYELTVELAEGGHSSMPSSEAAITQLAAAIVRLRDKPAPALLEGPTQAMLAHVGPEMDLPNKVALANLKWTAPLVKWQMSQSPASNAMLRTTVAPTLISGGFKENVLPARASAKVNCRIMPGETVASTLAFLKKTIANEQVKVSVSESVPSNDPPPVSGMGTFGYSVLQTTVREVFPTAVVAPSLVIATTDSRHFVPVSKNIYRFLPIRLKKEDTHRFHGKDERIGTEDYLQVVRFYRQLLLNACK